MIEKRQQDIVALPLRPSRAKQVSDDTYAFMSDLPAGKDKREPTRR